MVFMKPLHALSFVTLLAGSQACFASGDYTYLDYAIGITKPAYTSATGKYSAISGSFGLQSKAFVAFDVQSYDDSRRYNYDVTGIGIGAYTGIGIVTDLYGLAQVVRADLGNNNDSGYRLTVGVRTITLGNIELNAKIKHEDIYDKTNDSFAIGARYYFTPMFSLGASYETAYIKDSDMKALYGSVRLNF